MADASGQWILRVYSGKGSPTAGSGLSPGSQKPCSGLISSDSVHTNWAMVTPDPGQGILTLRWARAAECAKKCSPNGCMGFWGPQLCSPGCTGDIIDTRWDQPPGPTMCHTTGISLNISSLTRTSLLIPGWSKSKICSYSFYGIHNCTLPLGRRLEKCSEMQFFTHKFILDNLARITVLKSQKKSLNNWNINNKNVRNTFLITNSNSKCWVCAPNPKEQEKGGCSPKWLWAHWSWLPELHISEPSTAIPNSQSKPHVPEFQQGAPRSRAFPLHQHHHTDNLPTQTVAETIVYSDKM